MAKGAFEAVNAPLSVAVHGGLKRVSGTAHDWVSKQLNRLGFQVCFAADTPMRTAGGHVLSQDVREGTRLLSRDEWDANGSAVEKEAARILEQVAR